MTLKLKLQSRISFKSISQSAIRKTFKKMSKISQKIFFVINITLSVVFAILWIKSIQKELLLSSQDNWASYLWIVEQFKAYYRELLHLDSSYQQILGLCSIYLFFQYILKSIFQFLDENIKQKSPKSTVKITKCLNNIVESTLLYGMIVGFLVLYLFITKFQVQNSKNVSEGNLIETVSQSKSAEEQLIFLILETFLVGRVLFSVGYIFGVLIDAESFRAAGVALTMASVSLSISHVYNFNIWAYF